MANVRNSNTFYIDTQYSAASDALAVRNIRVLQVLVTATAASAVLLLSDNSGAAPKKIDLRVATSGATQHFTFDVDGTGVVFPNGIRPTTLTNCVATCIIEETQG